MKHLRADYDAIQPWPTKRPHHAKIDNLTRLNCDDTVLHGAPEYGAPTPIIPDDEPVFLLRGQDPSSMIAVQAWADDVERHDGDPEMVRAVRAWAITMHEWWQDHGTKAVADVPEGMLRG